MKHLAWLLLFTLPVITSCHRDPLKVPISNIDLDVDIHRFEKDLFSLELDSIQHQLPALNKKYEQFLPLFGYIINIGEPSDPAFPRFIRTFLTDRINNEVYTSTMEVFNDFDKYQQKLIRAFKYFRYHFPDKPIPDMYTFISRFNSSIILDTNLIAIGLDRYLGSDYEFYANLGLPQYMRARMRPEQIVPDCLYAWGSSEFSFRGNRTTDVTDNVLSNMLYQGKLMYFVSAMMPGSDEYQIIGFSPGQMKWCRDNEGIMWTYLIENDLLFNTDHLTIRKLTGEAPYTSYFPRESPGRASVWIGWQIIKKYMERHPEITLEQLMNNAGYQDILSRSKYNPR